jgi:hypothetical protein
VLIVVAVCLMLAVACLVAARLLNGDAADRLGSADASGSSPPEQDPPGAASRVLAMPGGPTSLAVLFALLSWPAVALSLDGVYAPPDTYLNPDVVGRLPADDLGRWSAAAGAVVAAALISGTIGGLLVRRHAKLGGLATFLLAWASAIAALPVLPALLHRNVAFADFLLIDGYSAPINSGDPTTGVGALVYLPLSPLFAPIPFALLLLGVVVWTMVLRHLRIPRTSRNLPA